MQQLISAEDVWKLFGMRKYMDCFEIMKHNIYPFRGSAQWLRFDSLLEKVK